MTQEQAAYAYRAIIRHLAGDSDKAKDYIRQAVRNDPMRCKCGAKMTWCKYGGKVGRLCTTCGTIWHENKTIGKVRNTAC